MNGANDERGALEVCAKNKSHCWHPTGVGSSHFSGGTDNMQCCYCGNPGLQEWRLQSKRISGHGAYATRSVKVTEPVRPIAPLRFEVWNTGGTALTSE